MIDEGRTVTFRVRGRSMRPMIEGDRDSVVLEPCCSNLRVNDVVLAEILPKCYALHRIESINGNMITMRGDGNIRGTEIFPKEAIVGQATAFIRKGRHFSLNSRRWKIYSAIWPKLLPIRRYLLFIIYPHIPQRFKNLVQ